MSKIVNKFIRAIDLRSSAVQYTSRLLDFERFLQLKYEVDIDQFIANITKYDIYDVLSEYRISLRDKYQKNTINSRIATVRQLLEYNDVPIVKTKWRVEVRPPRVEQIDKFALTKDLVRRIIIGCQLPRLQTFVHVQAATGMRSTEALSLLFKHLDLDKGTVYLRKEFTKTKHARTVFLTREVVEQLKRWIEYRNRERRVVDTKGKAMYKRRTLEPDTPIFYSGRFEKHFTGKRLYTTIATEFAKALDQMGLSEMREVGDRHKITLHSFRSFVKTTISDLGYQDFSEWFIGHKHSTYWSKQEKEKLELFHKIEPYLTYLDYSGLEAHGADIETKLSEKDSEIQAMRMKYEQDMQKMREEMNQQFNQIMSMIQQNPKLAQVKPEILTKNTPHPS